MGSPTSCSCPRKWLVLLHCSTPVFVIASEYRWTKIEQPFQKLLTDNTSFAGDLQVQTSIGEKVGLAGYAGRVRRK